MNPNLFTTSSGQIVNIAGAAKIEKQGTSTLVLTYPDASQLSFSDSGNTVYNKILATSN